MQVKYLLKTAYYRVRGLHLVFEPGGVYDIDPATVGALGLLTKTDGFGWKVFEAVKAAPPKDPVAATVTPEDVFAENQKKRDAEITKTQSEKTAERKATAEKLRTNRETMNKALRAAGAAKREDDPEKAASVPMDGPEDPGKGKPKDTPKANEKKGTKAGGKLSDKLKATHK
jgi:hypothetical protein